MNVRFVVRGVLLALPLAVIAVAAWFLFQSPFGLLPEPTPPAPTIDAPPGEMPQDSLGLQEFTRYRGADYGLAGSGFFLSLPDGDVVGVTTAHSVMIGNTERPLERIALGAVGQPGFLGEYDTLRGLPGRHLTANDMSIDYVLLHVTSPIDPAYILEPDPRGAPQPGERVSLFNGVAKDGAAKVLEGTVQSVSDEAVWLLMDDLFNPALMSGSPVLSQHTGQVVGMAVAASPRRGRLLLGLHPIGSLVQKANEATEFPRLGE